MSAPPLTYYEKVTCPPPRKKKKVIYMDTIRVSREVKSNKSNNYKGKVSQETEDIIIKKETH